MDLPCVEIIARALDEIRMLKELTWHYVILNTDLVTVQYGQKRIVRETLNIMIEAASREKQWNLFPGACRGELEAARNGPNREQETLRIAVDYVAGMTETELIKTYDALTAGT
jgi:dGTP triphosphohydrolase